MHGLLVGTPLDVSAGQFHRIPDASAGTAMQVLFPSHLETWARVGGKFLACSAWRIVQAC